LITADLKRKSGKEKGEGGKLPRVAQIENQTLCFKHKFF